MTEENEKINLISLEEIKEFKLDENEFNIMDNKLNEDFKYDVILYHDEKKEKIKYKGTIKNNKYEGRGICYDHGHTSNGYFKNGCLEGFGRYEYRKIIIVGFFKDNTCIKGIMKYNNKKRFEYEFKPDRHSVIGNEFFSNGNLKTKTEYEYGYEYEYDCLKPKKYSYGVLYDENNNIIYSCLLKYLRPKEANNITLFNKYGEKMYFGNISNFLYNDDNNAHIYHDTCLGIYLYYEGGIKNDKYNGFGKIYYCQNKSLQFQGNFKDGEINGKGTKYYENGMKKIEGIFENKNICTGIYYNPSGEKIYTGKIINEIPFNGINLTVYDDNTNKIYEGSIKEGKYEGFGIEYYNLIKDKILYKGIFNNNYYIEQNLNYYEKEKINISVYTYQHCYPCCEFTEKFITGKIGSFGNKHREGREAYNFEYNSKKFVAYFNYFSLVSNRKFSKTFVNSSKIVIFVIDISFNEEYIDSEYIKDIIKSKNPETLVYVIVIGIEECSDDVKFIKFRNQAKVLITEGIITKYFEMNLYNDIGLDCIKKNLIIDSAIKRNFIDSAIKIISSEKYHKNCKLLKYINL